MKRRRLLQSLAALPAVPAAAQTTYAQPAAASPEFPKLSETAPDAVGDSKPRLFHADQMAALSKLADLILPATSGRPGAVEAGVPAFLDFLLSESNSERQKRYRDGLDKLNSEAKSRYSKPFSALTADEAKPILAPLSGKWTYHPPTDNFARFLREAKDDLLQATVNSRQFATAMSRRSRSAAGLGDYWLPLD